MADTFRGDAEQRFGTVGDAMTKRVIAFEPNEHASDAALRLGVEGIAGGPVVDGDVVVGIITLRDLLEREGHTSSQTTGPFLRAERHLANLSVADVMTKDVVTIRAEEPLVHALEVMDSAGVNRLPVVNGQDRPVGILARDDVLHAIAQVLRS